MLAQQAVVTEYKRRLEIRGSFLQWCRVAGYEPALHHKLIISELEQLVENLIKALIRGQEVPEERLRLMVMTPPGSAKSTYISKLFPPWFLAQMNRIRSLMLKANPSAHVEPLGILACSHAADLAVGFGRAARNLISSNELLLGYSLRQDTRAADDWATTHGCYYRAAGVGAGISGKRMHLGVIDDFCGQEQEAGSKLFNTTVWEWYVNDFVNRLQPISARVIIANHRNEDDLCGRILADPKEILKWKVIRLRLRIDTAEQAANDPLGRKIGEILWPEYFNKDMVDERMTNPKASGIQQQEPSPQEGDLFKKEWILGYTPEEAPNERDSTAYGASDHAVRTAAQNDCTCMGYGRFRSNMLYIMPDLEWDRFTSDIAVAKMLRLINENDIMTWWAEKENISGAIGPFLDQQMLASGIFCNVEEVSTGNKDKIAMAQSIIALTKQGYVRWPTFVPWWPAALYQMLKFPNGSHDDFITFISLLGKGIRRMFNTKKPPVDNSTQVLVLPVVPLTMRWLKDQDKDSKRNRRLLALDR